MSTNLSAHPLRRALNWGATGRETTEALPGDDLLPDGRSITNALDISAPPSDVWPWIVQIGRGRASFYTYTWIENLLALTSTTSITLTRPSSTCSRESGSAVSGGQRNGLCVFL